RKNENRRDHCRDRIQDAGNDGSPDPPSIRKAANDGEKDRYCDRSENNADQQSFEFIIEPGTKTLGGETVLMLANVALIVSERKREDSGEDDIFNPVDDVVHEFESGDALGEAAHFGRPAEIEQQ